MCVGKGCVYFTNHIFIALCQFSVTVAGFGLFLFGPVKLRIRPRTLCLFRLNVLILLLSIGLDKGSDDLLVLVSDPRSDPRPLLVKTERSDTSSGAVVKPLALTTQD